MDVRGQKVVVTGGNRGIGWGIARAFAQRGADVAILCRNAASGTEAARKLAEDGGAHLCMECDITKPEMVESAVAAVFEAWGHADVLINNAGITAVKAFLDMEPGLSEWNQVIDADLKGTVKVTYEVAKRMRHIGSGGSIINISSTGGMRCGGSKELPMSGYVAAKAAINHLTVSWAIEFADADIRVNTIMPGPTSSDLDEQLTDEYRAEKARNILTRRYGEGIEIGAFCVFLSSAEGSHINGAVIPHDGGFLCINA